MEEIKIIREADIHSNCTLEDKVNEYLKQGWEYCNSFSYNSGYAPLDQLVFIFKKQISDYKLTGMDLIPKHIK